jgi:hypothetical protein
MNARISNRVMDIAESFGIATDRAELCRPNVRIGFTSRPQALVERAFRRNRQVIGFHYAAQSERIMHVRQPVQAWYVTTTRTSENTQEIDDANVRAPGGVAGSRLSSGISSGLYHVLIFVDTRYVDGANADSMADLLAFVALAQTPVAETCDEADTILNLMNPACPPSRHPAALTRYDMAYLSALYETNAEWNARMQRGAIVGHMTNRLVDH